MLTNIILGGDVIERLSDLPDNSVQCVVTSPPYWKLRSYLPDDDPLKHLEIGLEETIEDYIEKLVQVFRGVRRVLRNDGTLWLNIGDSYACSNHFPNKVQGNPEFNKNRPSRALTKTPLHKVPEGVKKKDLLGIPWTLALALRIDGWYLRSEIIWHRTNPMPEGKIDRPTKSHEQLFLLAKSEQYYYNADAIRTPLKSKTYTTFGSKYCTQGNDPLGNVKSANWGDSLDTRKPRLNENGEIAGANKRSVWDIAASTYRGAHFAVMPEKLVEPCILAGSKEGDIVLDPFCGAGTVPVVAIKNKRSYIGIELNEEYIKLTEQRLAGEIVSCP